MCTVLCPPMLFMAIPTTLSGMCISALFLLGLGGWGVAWVFDLEGQIGIIWGVTWGVKMALKWMRVKGGNTRLPPLTRLFLCELRGV